jgi:hypothetical protein
LTIQTIYVNAPTIALSQPDATHIALAAVTVSFGGREVKYNPRTLEIPAPSAKTTYFVTIADRDYLGDEGTSTELAAYIEENYSKCGEPGYIYMGAIECTPGRTAIPMPGGWPAPQHIVGVC